MTIKHLFPVAKPTLDLNFAAERALDPRITFTRASIGTYVDASGIVRTAVDDEPRFDHDPETGTSLGLLIEESRTNYIQNSIDFNAGDWTFTSGGTAPGIPVCTPNSGTAPDGTNTATRMVCDTGGGTTSGDACYLRCNRDSSTRAVESMWIKSNTGSDQTIYMTAQQQPVIATNTWKRVLSLSNDYRIGARGDKSQQNIDILIWGAQVEDGDSSTGFHTSYIPTAAATATRAVDIASITGDNFSSWYNQSEGTLYYQYNAIGGGQLLSPGTIRVSNTQDAQSWGYWMYTGAGQDKSPYAGQRRSPDEPVFLADGNIFGSTIMGQSYKVVVGHDNSTLSACLEGYSVQSRAITSLPTMTQFSIGFVKNSAANKFTGHISRLSYYSRRLPDEQLQALTS